MFETSVVHARVQAAPARRLSLLSISVLAHSAVVIGAVALSIASVDFPKMAPDEFARAPQFVQVRIPPPLGTPEGNNRPVQPKPEQPKPEQPKPAPQPAPQPVNQVAPPQTTPETIPTVARPSTATGENTGPAIVGTGPRGLPDGDPNTIDTGGELLPGTGTDPVAPPNPTIIYEASQVDPPVGIYKPQPPYPSILMRTRMAATVVVRCVIDRNGRVRDAQILAPALPPFNQSVLDTVSTWRFKPGQLNGQPVETYLNLQVHFAVR